MKIRKILFVFIVFGSFSALSKNNISAGDCSVTSQKRLINSLDSVIIDLANAIITPTYIDIALYIKSDDVINALDYELQFNLAKLTFSATTDLVPNDNTFLSSSSFNPNDLFLRYSGTTFQGLPTNGLYSTKIRFSLNAACSPISSADFTNVTTLLNGISVPHRFTNLNFSQFIPIVSYTASPFCLNTVVQFSNTSTLATGSITSWTWNLGNNVNSATQNPVTIYTVTGTYTASLIALTAIGCCDTMVTIFTINPFPVASISPVGTSTFCPVNNFTLTAPANMASYLWSNGATTQSVISSNAGTYSLQVADASGCIAFSTSSATQINVLPSDFDKNGVVDVNDFSLFITLFGSSCACAGDLNHDGKVDIDDFLLFVPAFNMTCQ